MIIASLFRWWYGEGFMLQCAKAWQRLLSTTDFFSISLLLKTLFSPFKQISSEQVQGSANVRWHAWVDKLFSRLIGAVFRIFTIIAGLLVIIISSVGNVLLIIAWLLVPVLPIVGVALSVSGWMPWIK